VGDKEWQPMKKFKADHLVFVDAILDYLGIIIINVITILVFIGVILRYIFKLYAPITSEIPLQLTVILALMMPGIIWKQKKHVTIDFVYHRFPSMFQFILDLVFSAGALFAGIIWLWGAIQLFLSDLTDRSVSIELRIPWGYYHIFAVIAFGIFIVYMIAEIAKLVTKSEFRKGGQK